MPIIFSILSLIAEGKTTQREIDSIINKNTGSYLANLEDEYSLIKKVKPMFAKPNSRATRYCLQDNFLRFWFRFYFLKQRSTRNGEKPFTDRICRKEL